MRRRSRGVAVVLAGLASARYRGLDASSSFQMEMTCPSPYSAMTRDLASSRDLATMCRRMPGLSWIQIKPTYSRIGLSLSFRFFSRVYGAGLLGQCCDQLASSASMVSATPASGVPRIAGQRV